jgi:hypothetical protein
VLIVDQQGEIVWQYGQAGVTGAGPDLLNTPVQAKALPIGDVLITDQGNERVIETPDKQIVWQYGETGVVGSRHDELNNLSSAQLLQNEHVLIADENNNRVRGRRRAVTLMRQVTVVTVIVRVSRIVRH